VGEERLLEVCMEQSKIAGKKKAEKGSEGELRAMRPMKVSPHQKNGSFWGRDEKRSVKTCDVFEAEKEPRGGGGGKYGGKVEKD